MDHSLVMFKEMAYDRCVESIFYTIIGFLDEHSGEIRGIEISEKECDITSLNSVKQHLKDCITRVPMRLFCGRVGETFDYYTFDLRNGLICSGNAKSCEEKKCFTGIRYLHENQTTQVSDSFYNTIDSMSYQFDAELREIIQNILVIAGQNYTWNGIQQALMSKPYARSRSANKILEKILQR